MRPVHYQKFPLNQKFRINHYRGSQYFGESPSPIVTSFRMKMLYPLWCVAATKDEPIYFSLLIFSSLMFGASLCALRKKDGGIRPVAVGSFYRRLAGRIADKHASISTSNALLPIQLCVGVPQGCEAAVHACRAGILKLF